MILMICAFLTGCNHNVNLDGKRGSLPGNEKGNRYFYRRRRGGKRKDLKLLFEQHQNRFVKFFNRKIFRGGSKDGVIPGDSAQNAFRFT